MMGKDIVFDDDYYVVDYVNSVYVEIVQDSLGRKLLENEFDIANDVLLCAGLKVVKLSQSRKTIYTKRLTQKGWAFLRKKYVNFLILSDVI